MGSSSPRNTSLMGSLATGPVPQIAQTCTVETTTVQLRQLGQIQLFLTVSGHKLAATR